jgi:creatinine amidohydrolase/Fe(II)-dependent formamide hydrolase-like protein
MRGLVCALWLAGALPLHAQILQVEELSVRDLNALNRAETIVIIPGGILEEHGPHLPSFTDGYLNRWLANRTAEALLAARGGTILMFPMIPLGAGSPEDFGGLAPFSGSYTIRPETLRAVYMDLAASLGNNGFRTVFAINRHGAPSHNWALLEASEYFNERFGGTMVPLTALQYQRDRDTPSAFTPAQAAQNGLEIHAGAGETSQTLFLRPHLVHDDYSDAESFTVNDVGALVDLAQAPGWPGYFGAPGVATAQAGAQLVAERTQDITDLALRILDGFDWRALPNRGDLDNLNSSFETLDANLLARSERERLAQEAWIEGRRQ